MEPIGVYGVSAAPPGSNIGVVAESDSSALEAVNPDEEEYVELADTEGAEAVNLILGETAGSPEFYARNQGTVRFYGTVTDSKGVHARTRGASGAARIAYGSRDASPEIEDVGEAQMTDGRAYVALDPVLADSIDMRRPYDVFVTPEGNAKSLYVAQTGPRGFVVRESHGGRSTLAFDYRVVGKPVDDDARRLAVAPPLPPTPARPARGARIPAPLSPEARAVSLKGSR